MSLTQLLSAAGVEPLDRRGNPPVLSLCADSRKAQPGCCFVAVKGPVADGHRFIGQALAAGASTIVCEQPAPEGAVGWVQVASAAEALGKLAQAWHGLPSRKLQLIGVTGTKGKTTFTHLVRHVLTRAGAKAGVVGTIRYEWPGQSLPAPNTTPGQLQLAEMMAVMLADGVTHMVMEVSSHALHQHRTAGLEFGVATFTNLSGDHLDYHHTMEAYLDAKAMLFDRLSPQAVAAVNADDPASRTIAQRSTGRVLWYGLDGPAELRGQIQQLTAAGAVVELTHRRKSATLRTNLLGRHNVANCLAATAACLGLGMDLREIAVALSEPLAVPGRLQRVGGAEGFEVLVDYAHTDDALDNALSAVRPLTENRLVVVFGCGGDRDRSKRARMARVAQNRADRIIVTSDNPRSEDPQQIIDDILEGFDAAGRAKLTVEPDRKAAIEQAVAEAQPGDVILLAGKGHETYQIIGSTRRHFDDAEVAAAALADRREGGR